MNKLDVYLTPQTKKKKTIPNGLYLNVNGKTIKLQEKNIRDHLYDLRVAAYF